MFLKLLDLICKSCAGNLLWKKGALTCEDCGFIVKENHIDISDDSFKWGKIEPDNFPNDEDFSF